MAVTKPTVLILGAGASAPFGFPLGVILRNDVLRGLDGGGVYQVLRELGHADAELKRFHDELQHAAYGSVDVFLEKNTEFLQVGKRAIAAALLPCEREEKLFPPVGPTQHWYEVLANRMEAGAEGWANNRLSVVTFNYDRSLEHYFTQVIAQRGRLSPEDAHEQLRRVPLVHVHGVLGDYPARERPGLPYGAPVSAASVDAAARRLLVVGEVPETLPTFGEAAELLRRADRIYFMGFGYNLDSIRCLRFFEEQRDTWPTILGTVTGMFGDRSNAMVTYFGRRWCGGFTSGPDVYGFVSMMQFD